MAARTAKKKSIQINTIPIEGLITSDIESNGTTPESNGKSLPKGFAEEVLKLEMDIEISETLELKQVHRLIELYALGVGYYESIGDTKYLYFHKKMNNLMMKPNVLESMNNSVKEQKEVKRRQSLQTDTFFASQPKQQIQSQEQNGQFQEIHDEQKQMQQVSQEQKQSHNSQVRESEATHNTFSQEVESVEKIQQEKQIAAEEKKVKQISLIKKKTIEENIKLNIIYGMQDNEDKSKSILKMHQLDQQRVKEFVNKQVETQVDDIKKRLEQRRNQTFNRALSLPINNESDTSLSDIDVVQPLPNNNKKCISSQTNIEDILDDVIQEDEKEDIFTRENSKRNSLDFQHLREGNQNILEQLKQERNIEDIISLRSRRKTTLSHRKNCRLSLMNHKQFQLKSVDSSRVRSFSNDHAQNNTESINITEFDNNIFDSAQKPNNTQSMIERY
ncbi:hypothetical protein TTHERM_00721740 (macronuclear) [Tetrahymena thermophila SB210]|uniref:Uncharacterized protein n=1 Tax=Tetrahymena thermophila (strain SB210) TaxID=312017 RepID=Q22FY3_TETTS|nr:hypothetical protein TTHERM_00721740 [Tetrahymena thermophila SB210]EAR84243.1 hypothetical protein TTHERM_00721740 [Tetrahymena thermophila SB210]|eukprot:XP_001031906.1 hypothetical protein TTHERM_00721740 [Tetrahymena thermophila SB210]